MKPPIRVSVSTDNLLFCTLHIRGAGEGEELAIKVRSHGNVYQGLHAAREQIELAFNEVLAAHGIFAPEPPSERAPLAPVDLSELEAEVEALRQQKAEQDAHAASVARSAELEAEKAKLLEALQAQHAGGNFVLPDVPPDQAVTPDAPAVEETKPQS